MDPSSEKLLCAIQKNKKTFFFLRSGSSEVSAVAAAALNGELLLSSGLRALWINTASLIDVVGPGDGQRGGVANGVEVRLALA